MDDTLLDGWIIDRGMDEWMKGIHLGHNLIAIKNVCPKIPQCAFLQKGMFAFLHLLSSVMKFTLI